VSRTRIALTIVVAALAVAPAVALGGGAQTAANSTTFPDSVGEDAQAPDITSTTVSNDDTGLITFHVAISNRPALTPDMLLELDLDTDANTATGDPQGLAPGTDYLIQLVPGSVNLFKWSGTDYPGAAAPSLIFTWDATGATIKINAKELGNTRAFNFGVIVISGLALDANGDLDLTNAHGDFTPDRGHGTFAYEVKVTVRLSVTAFTTSPKPVKAGKAFSVGLAATQSDTAGPVQTGRVTCVAKIAGKLVRVKSSRVVNGVAVCAWTVPKTAKGKRIQGSITLAAEGTQVTRSFSLKVT